MDLNKILARESHSSPQPSHHGHIHSHSHSFSPRRVGSPHLGRHLIMARRTAGPQEYEVAEFMIALANTSVPVPVSLPQTTSFVLPQQQQQQQQQEQRQSQQSHQSPMEIEPLVSDNATPPTLVEHKARTKRASPNTRKLVPSPSGQPCPNCSVETSTLWRTCEVGTGSSYLCNACGLRFKKGKFCPLCYRVYYDADTNQLHWKQCRSCLNWTHKACLQKCGSLSDNFASSDSYSCPNCRRDSHKGDH